MSLTVPAAAGLSAGAAAGISAPLQAKAQLNVIPALAGIGVRTVWTFPSTTLTGAQPAEPSPTAGIAALTMKADGKAPPVSSAIPGKLSFMATRLTLTFSSAGAKDTQVVCTTTDDSGAKLATVSVTQSESAVSGNHGRGGRVPLTAGPNAGSVSTLDDPGDDDGYQKVSAYLYGFSNVKKLSGAALVGPGLADLKVYFPVQDPVTGDYDVLSVGTLVIPPADSTFLTFGFMPTTATMELKQVTPLNIKSHSHLDGDNYITTNISTVQMSLRVYNLKVNGTPLDVGPNCRAVEPLNIVLSSEGDYDPGSGGTFAGSMTIPTFVGCGVGEDLNPLLSASISGPGNIMRMTQGPGCFYDPPPEYQCPPVVPEPKR
jgi:hypothetical protein